MREEKKSTPVPLVYLTLRSCPAWCALLTAAALMLSLHAEADVPEVVVANVTASSAVAPTQPSAFEIIPEDPLAARLRFSGKTKTYKKTFYLRGYSLGQFYWLDNHRFITDMHGGPGFEAKYGEVQPKIVLVDILAGTIEDTGLVGKMNCYSEGMISIGTWELNGKRTMYFGKWGESLKAYAGGFPADMELNYESCQLVPRWGYPKNESGKPRLAGRFPLKVEHGTIYEWKPSSFPELRIGQDEQNRFGFYRTGSAQIPPLQLYWEQPSGKRIDIPLNPGEKISSVYFLPYEQAYLLTVDLTSTQPIEIWGPRFMRLLYLDGTVKRFGVPAVIMKLVGAGKVIGAAKYTKQGIRWVVGFKSREPDNLNIGGVHAVSGDELVKIEPYTYTIGPDGCREYSHEDHLFSKYNDYFYIDVCKGE